MLCEYEILYHYLKFCPIFYSLMSIGYLNLYCQANSYGMLEQVIKEH